MADETTTETSQTAETQNTSDATVQNTEANASGTGTQTATTEAQPEKTFTQADIDRIVQNRLKSAVKAELKKLTADDPEKPNVEELQRQLSERDTKLRAIEARESVTDYLSDARHKLNVKPENVRAIVKLVMPDLEYDDEGKPSNIKDAIENAKSLAPALFANTPGSIDANAGRNGHVTAPNMNQLIRQQAGYGN